MDLGFAQCQTLVVLQQLLQDTNEALAQKVSKQGGDEGQHRPCCFTVW